jgi:acetyltransferase
MSSRNLNFIFNPKSVAVIGASNEKDSVGYDLFANLAKSKFKGRVVPVNIKRKKVQGKTAYPSISAVPGKIDLAIIAVPAKIVPPVVEECGRKKVKGIVIISAGFNEIGEEGKKLQMQIGEIAKKYGIRIIGPNCLGFMHPAINLNASFASRMALPGKIGLISQSGALCTAILDWSEKNNIGFSYFVSIGSMVDVNFNDLLEYINNDKKTESILIYMESINAARKFVEIAGKVSLKKPIFILKTGRCLEGAKAAKSHTGSLTGNDQVFSAAFIKAGITRIDAVEDLFNVSKGISMQPQPQGRKLAIVTNAGGVGVIASDSLIFSGGQLANLDKKTMVDLDKILPTNWSHNNPVDILGDAEPERYRKAIEICAKDKNIDGILVILSLIHI